MPEKVPASAAARPTPCGGEGGCEAGDQRQRVERVDHEDASDRERMIGERQPQLGSVDGQPVEQRMGDQREPGGEPPAARGSLPSPWIRWISQASNGDTRRQVEEGVALGPVERHVADRVAVVDQHVEVRQRAAEAAPEGRLPDAGASAHDRDADGRAECNLCHRIHGAILARPLDPACGGPAVAHRRPSIGGCCLYA